MTLRSEIAIVIVIKLLLLIALKNIFFDNPTISEDRDALGRQLVAPPATSSESKRPPSL